MIAVFLCDLAVSTVVLVYSATTCLENLEISGNSTAVWDFTENQ